jgi:hypothetical protein
MDKEIWQSIYDELTIYEARAKAGELPAEHTQDIVTNKIYSLIQAWHLEKVQQVRKALIEECIKTMLNCHAIENLTDDGSNCKILCSLPERAECQKLADNIRSLGGTK